MAGVMHVLHVPLEELWEMDLGEIEAWEAEAAELCRALYGAGRRR